MKSRTTTIILIGFLLCIALAVAVFTAFSTVRAVQSLQQQHTLAKAGDVHTIRPWMTIPYISHTYHVPESYLYQSLHISEYSPPRHTPLHALAARYRRPIPEVVDEVQSAILTYRKQHSLHQHPVKQIKRTGTPTTINWSPTTRRQHR
ncbi:MAG: hypothetical protein NVSMB49_25190 [Ktedonobacteraceae bacterium]